jgi:hypothetical protein
VTHKIVFAASFFHANGAQPLCLLGVLHRGAIKFVVTPEQPTSSHMISLCSSASFPTAKRRERNRETNLERQKGSG